MNFATMSEFFSLGGHGIYVWLSYGMGLFFLVSIGVMPVLKRQSMLRELAQLQRRAAPQAGHTNAYEMKAADDLSLKDQNQGNDLNSLTGKHPS